MRIWLRDSHRRSDLRRTLPAMAILIAFFVLANVYAIVTPLWEAPDEVGHFAFVTQLLTTRTLPVQRTGELGEAHQPPLYYALAALAAWPADLRDQAGAFKPNPRFIWAGQGGNEVAAGQHTSDETFPFRGHALASHLAREVSIVMGLATVALTMAIGWRLFPKRPSIGLLGAILVAFNPQFLFISGAINNDNLLVLAATGGWWQTMRALALPDQRRQWGYLGIWIAVGLMAKLSGIVIGVVVGIVLLAFAIQRRSYRLFLYGTASMGTVVLLLCGWWFVRNQALYGDPLGWTMFKSVYAAVQRTSPLQWSDLGVLVDVQFRSFWGVFGWMVVGAPDWFYQAARLLSLLAVLGVIFFVVVQARSRQISGFQWTALAVLGLAVVAQATFVLGIVTGCDESCYQGRYLFPVIAPLMLFMSVGLVGLLPGKLTPLLAGGFALVLAGTALFLALHVIRPAYPMIPMPQWCLWSVSNRTDLTFDQMFELKGYNLRQDADGTQVVLTLYWQALRRPDVDYSVFAHLIDESNQIVAQEDHAPGFDRRYPPTSWWPGDIVADQHVIRAPSTLAPGTQRLRVGVYNSATGQQMPVSSKGESMGTFVVLEQHVQR